MQKTIPAPRLILFTIVRVILNTAHRMVYPFLAAFARGLGVDLTSISYLMTARPLVGILGPLTASLSDRLGRRMGILLGLGIFSVAASLVIIRPTFIFFFLSILLMTLGKYIFDISLVSWLADQIPYEQRGRMVAFTEFGWSLAFILGVPLVGFLIASRSWESPFLLFSLLGGLAFLILLISIPRESVQAGPTRVVQEKLSFHSIFRSKAILPIIASLSIGFFACAANESINLVFGIWLEDSFGLQITALGAAAAVIGISELSGEGLVAAFVDRLGKQRSVALGLLVNAITAGALPLLGRSEAGALVGLFLFYISFEFQIVSLYPLMSEILPSARATIMALNVTSLALGRALGAFCSPRLYTLGFPAVAVGAILFNLLALIGLWQVKRWAVNIGGK